MLRTMMGLGCAALMGGSMAVHAVEATIQGTTLFPVADGSTCIDISGEYPGVRVEASEAGKTPLICFSDAREDVLALRNATFVATNAVSQPGPNGQIQADAAAGAANDPSSGALPDKVVIEFRHTFPPGPVGKVMARAKIDGFFTTETGVEVATGDKVHFIGFFSQGGQEDPIADALEHEVGEDTDSALFDYKGKKRYLIAGPRTLKARLEFSFVAPGHRMTLLKGAFVSIDTGSRFEDKLEEMESGAEELLPEAEGEAQQEAPDLEEEFSF